MKLDYKLQIFYERGNLRCFRVKLMRRSVQHSKMLFILFIQEIKLIKDIIFSVYLLNKILNLYELYNCHTLSNPSADPEIKFPLLKSSKDVVH